MITQRLGMLSVFFGMLCMSNCCSDEAIAGEFVFEPSLCEFSVTFPVKYKQRKIIKNGTAGTAATARVSNLTSLGAECWPYIEKLQIETFARNMEIEAQQRGLSVNSVIIDKSSNVGERIILTGWLKTGGQKVYVKIISIMGTKSRLDLTIADCEIASRTQVDFRNSVKRK